MTGRCSMRNIINIDFTKKIGPIKRMNAVNNGPLPMTEEYTRTNFFDYKALRIPYARTHDAAFCDAYGGNHTVDVNFIFPNFNADENDPRSYDFQLTDEYLKTMIDAGTEPFFRLGSKIEHWSKKYNTLPPADFGKWARICEHIIAHYVEGWANGYRWKIDYWEIWNEADGARDDAPPSAKPCWGGTMAEFFRFYEIVAVHLKKRFPNLKIGGPATCCPDYSRGLVVKLTPWIENFFKYMSSHKVPIDFFSWHTYTPQIENIVASSKRVKKGLIKYGYDKTENILNEWNYIDGWSGNEFFTSIRSITGMKGAAFIAGAMCGCQNTPLDMLMYYDARPSVFNGMFDYYTQKPLKGYYPFLIFSKLVEMGKQVDVTCHDRHLYVLAAAGNGKKGVMISYYPSPLIYRPTRRKEDAPDKKITIRFDGKDPKVYLLDEYNDLTETNLYTFRENKLTVTMKPLSVLYIESK